MPIVIRNEDPALYAKLASNVGYARGQAQLRSQLAQQLAQQQQAQLQQQRIDQDDAQFSARNELEKEQMAARADQENAALQSREKIAADANSTRMLHDIFGADAGLERETLRGETARDVAGIRGENALAVEGARGANRLEVVGRQQAGADDRNDASIMARSAEGNLNRQTRLDVAGMRPERPAKTPAELTRLYLENARSAIAIGDQEGADYWTNLARELRGGAPSPGTPTPITAPPAPTPDPAQMSADIQNTGYGDSPDNAIRVSNPQQAASLPSGAYFVTPDGQIRRKR